MSTFRNMFGSVSWSFIGKLAVIMSLLKFFPSYALPPGYLMEPSGNERDINWQVFENKRFSLYTDSLDAQLGKFGLWSLEHAVDDMSYLIGVNVGENSKYPSEVTKDFVTSSFNRIPVILSTRSLGASFANFVNQGIEIHARTGDHASLFQHELAHRLMYEHIDPNFGPASRAALLAMIPTWWTEGFPESMTQSMGRLTIAGVSRSMAMHNTFLTYDRLNSLYNASGDISYRGYITAGRFFQYVINQTTEKNFRALHHSLFWKLLTPPFVVGVDWALEKHTGKNSKELYEAFKFQEIVNWHKKSESLPSIVEPKPSPVLSFSGGVPDLVKFGQLILRSNLDEKNQPSALIALDLEKNIKQRIPLDINASSNFDMVREDFENGGFWTTRNVKQTNGVETQDPVYVKFNGSFAKLTNKTVEKVVSFPMTTEKDPVTVQDILAVGQNRAFLLTNTRGVNTLYFLDAVAKSFAKLKSWRIPVHAYFLKKRKPFGSTCVTLSLDWDFEQTSLEQVCLGGKSREIVPRGKYLFLAGVEEAANEFLLTVGWGEFQGLARVSNGNVIPIAPYKEFSKGLIPWGNKDEVATFIYDGQGDYDLFPISISSLEKQYKGNQLKISASFSPLRLEEGHRYEPPYVRLAREQRKRDGVVLSDKLTSREGFYSPEETTEPKADSKTDPKTDPKLDPKSTIADSLPQNTSPHAADYRSHHVFTYPTLGIPGLGGASLGFISWPLLDELWRYRVEAQGEYHFETQKFSGTLSYINNRIADSFYVSAFARERFNGFSHFSPCPEDTSLLCYDESVSVTSTLRENGATVGIGWNHLPTTLRSNYSLSLAKLERSTGYRSAASETLLGTIDSSWSWTTWKQGFYLKPETETGGQTLGVSLGNAFGVSYSESFGKVTDGRGQEKHSLQFYKLWTSLTNSYQYRDVSLTLRGKIGTTLGPYGLNLKEYYQPYKTYIVGSAINGLNYSLLGTSGLFNYSDGYWSWATDATYSFPIVKAIDKQIFIAYIDGLAGEVVVGRGGVAKDKNFKVLQNVTSISLAAKLTIDVRGFGIFPSIAYGRLIGKPGWSLFFQLSFSEFV